MNAPTYYEFSMLLDEVVAEFVADGKSNAAYRQTRSRDRMEKDENALLWMKLNTSVKLP